MTILHRTPKPDYDLIAKLERETGVSADRIMEAAKTRTESTPTVLGAFFQSYRMVFGWLFNVRGHAGGFTRKHVCNIDHHYDYDCGVCWVLSIIVGVTGIFLVVASVLEGITAVAYHDIESMILCGVYALLLPPVGRLTMVLARHGNGW